MKENKSKKILYIIIGILTAILFSAPYIIFREQIEDAVVVGYISLILMCAISNVSILIPTSSTVITLAAATTLNPWLCVLCAGVGTAIGEQSSYICGRIGGMGFSEKPEKEAQVVKWLKEKTFLTIFLFAFIPLPVFDVAGIASGALKVHWVKYTIAAVSGKILKFALTMAMILFIIPMMAEYFPSPIKELLGTLLEQFNS